MVSCSDGSGSKIFEISLKNVKFFNFLPFGSKKLLRVGSESTQVKAGSASYLLRVKSKLGSARVESGHGPSLVSCDLDWSNHMQNVVKKKERHLW